MSIFEQSLQTVNNETTLTEEQKKKVKELEASLGKADKALSTGIKTLKKQFHKPEQKPEFLRQHGQLMGDHAAYRATIVAQIRKIQPTWADNTAEAIRNGAVVADNVATLGIGKAAGVAAYAASPIVKQTGNMAGAFGKAFGKAFKEGLEAGSSRE